MDFGIGWLQPCQTHLNNKLERTSFDEKVWYKFGMSSNLRGEAMLVPLMVVLPVLVELEAEMILDPGA